jgi:MoaA/NifB/PqqE/SkfB family radical SAM enzyme
VIRARHLRLAARFAAHRWRALHPFEVQAALLNACNLRCAYCRCPDEQTRVLTTAQWLEIIRGLAALGTMRIKFQGGEPTLRRDFRALCAAARAAGIVTAVVTNGLAIAADPTLLDELDEVVFSLDSPDAARNDAQRGPGVHAQVTRALDAACARRLPTFINMVVTRDTLGDIDAMLDFCAARGVGLHAQPVVFGRRYYDDAARPLAPTRDQIVAMHRQLAAWKRAGRPIMFSAASYEQVTTWPDHDQLTTPSAAPSACMAGRFYVHLEPNGDVQPCTMYEDAAFTPRNAVRDGLEAALRHVRTHHCGDCFVVYLNERKALFGLRPSTLLEVLRRG